MDTPAAEFEVGEDHLHEVERALKERFEKGETKASRLPSTAAAPADNARVDQLVLPDEERAKMPYTKDQFLVRENPALVKWEREVRKFLRNLSPQHGHRVAAVMIFEWATGLKIADLDAEEKRRRAAGESLRGHTSWRADLRKINELLREYFGKPYMTYIMGRKVPRAYRVPAGWYVYRHRPRTLTLYAEWSEGAKL